MKTHSLSYVAVVWLGLFATLFISTSPLQADDEKHRKTDKVIPLIVFDDARLEDAIRNLARMAGINYILDPRVSGGPGRFVTARWEKLTAEQMLRKLLQQHRLQIIENPATSVARIAPSHEIVTPVPANQVGNDTTILPVIQLNDVTLNEAIKNIAAQAKLNISLDPQLDSSQAFPTLSFRWEKLTAKQALAAVLDNYNLQMVSDPANANPRITAKKPNVEKSSPPRKNGKD